MTPRRSYTSPVDRTMILVVVIVTLLVALTSGQVIKRLKVPGGVFDTRFKRPKVMYPIEETYMYQGKKGECEEIYLPMCKGLVPYNYTRLPNRFNHHSQMEVYTELESLWSYMDLSCSKNLRFMICATYLPKCDNSQKDLEPCQLTCYEAKKKCGLPLEKFFNLKWEDQFDCKELPTRHCLEPVEDDKCRHKRRTCVENWAIPICSNLTFSWGVLPNKFGQCSIDELNTEINYYDALIATECHPDLNFLICGVYSPFCIKRDNFYAPPCHDLCQEVQDACSPHYKRLYHGLPWPKKLECQRYPTGDNVDCVMPPEGGSSYFGV